MMSRSLAWLLVWAALARAMPPARAADAEAISLPEPVSHRSSFALVSNSRYSVYAGFSDSLPRTVLGNVVWAMARALTVISSGPEWTLYVAMRSGVYRYEPASRRLVLYRAGDRRYSSASAYEIGVATQSCEVAGAAVQAGLLAATAFRQEPNPRVVACPLGWAADNANLNWGAGLPIRMVVVLGAAEALPLDSVVIARPADGSLPRPQVIGQDSFVAVVRDLEQDDQFRPFPLSDATVAQLLWAGRGVTPHLTFNNQQGLTVPALATDQQAIRLYLLNEQGLGRYVSAAGPAHRLVWLGRTNLRPGLRLATGRIPSSAPCYVVVTVADTGSANLLLEAGATAFQLLGQARALGLSGRLVLSLSAAERLAVSAVLGLEKEVPVIVFAAGEPAQERLTASPEDIVSIVRADPAIRRGRMELRYLLKRSGPVRVEVFDMLGRSVLVLLDEEQSAGLHDVNWDGTGPDGRRLKRGTYLVTVSARRAVVRHKVNLG